MVILEHETSEAEVIPVTDTTSPADQSSLSSASTLDANTHQSTNGTAEGTPNEASLQDASICLGSSGEACNISTEEGRDIRSSLFEKGPKADLAENITMSGVSKATILPSLRARFAIARGPRNLSAQQGLSTANLQDPGVLIGGGEETLEGDGEGSVVAL
jgi:hypothetical protein